MTRRVSVLIVAVAVAAGAAGAVLYARDSARTAKPPTGACTDWFVSPAYRREINSVRALVPRMKRAFAAPGLSVAIAADGKLVWSQGCGFADLERRRAVTRTTQFRVGSVSKTLTAATIARLAQQGPARRRRRHWSVRRGLTRWPRANPAPARRASRRHSPLPGRRSDQYAALPLAGGQHPHFRQRPPCRAAGRNVPLLELRLQPAGSGRREGNKLSLRECRPRRTADSTSPEVDDSRPPARGRHALLRGHRRAPC